MSGQLRATPAAGQKRTRVRPKPIPSGSRTIDLSPEPERSAKHRSVPHANRDLQPDFRLAIDFGTKFTTIAWTKGNETKESIFTIEEFPDDPMPGRVGTQVPTEIAYLRRQTDRQEHKQTLRKIIYGYEIQTRRDLPKDDDDDYEDIGHVTNVKLLLDKSSHLKHLRKELMDLLKQLRTEKAIQRNEDAIRDLLICYLRHGKEILQKDHGLTNNSKVEVTFCVPVCWNPSANATMSACLQEAMRRVDLGVERGGICSLFMVNEAEAAAMYALTSDFHQLKWGEVFMLLDCGGGTTDVGVYQIGHEHPFRLGREVVPTAGVVCGSGDLNRRFREFAIENLKDAQYPEMESISIESLVDSELMLRFENMIKRSFSVEHKNRDKTYPFPLRGLQASKGNARVRINSFVLSFQDMEDIFMPSLTTIADLMEKQILRALRKNADVDKVVLAGGFGDSPALKRFITTALDRINSDTSQNIKLIVTPPNTGAAGVATGALMRARNKEHGPAKVPCLSIGIYHHVRHEPDRYSDDVLGQDDWKLCDLDGEWYINDTIKWIFKVGEGKFEPVHEFKWEDLHIFTPAHTKAWPAEYELFASDTCTYDFYTRSHAQNYGKTFKIGKVAFDLMHIKEHIEMHVPTDEGDGEERYEVTVCIKMRLIDKYLDFTAYWPAEGPPRVTIQGSHKHLNVVSAFSAGTA